MKVIVTGTTKFKYNSEHDAKLAYLPKPIFLFNLGFQTEDFHSTNIHTYTPSHKKIRNKKALPVVLDFAKP